MIKHPLAIGTVVEYDSRKCNCTFVRRNIKTGTIMVTRSFGGKFWYGLDNGVQVAQNKIIKIIKV